MKSLFMILAAFFALAAQAKESPEEHKKEIIAQHKAIAAAHQNAAECLASGKDEEVCHAAMAKACKGLALGKFCGMRHSH